MTNVLVVLAALTVWVVVLVVSPLKRCGRCKGKGIAPGRWSGRMAVCRRCRGERMQYRRGAVVVHRLRQEVVRDIEERRRSR